MGSLFCAWILPWLINWMHSDCISAIFTLVSWEDDYPPIRKCSVFQSSLQTTITRLCAIVTLVAAISSQAQNPDSAKGAITISSTPANAEIIWNGTSTGLSTPATLTALDTGIHTLELALSDYLFFQKNIIILPDSTLTVSFTLISSIDTAYVLGNEQGVGMLILPAVPIARPYLVDSRRREPGIVALTHGKHWVFWDGGGLFTSLDTMIEIYGCGVTALSFTPRGLFGRICITATPPDAAIELDTQPVAHGEFSTDLPAGKHSVTIRRKGYFAQQAETVIIHAKTTTLRFALVEIPDKDGDGFLDSIDLCPDAYGLYGGCASPPFAGSLRITGRLIADNMRADPFAVSFTLIGYLNRSPHNQGFKEFLSYFNDGDSYLNNLNGIVALNTISVSWWGFDATLSLGQWNSGLEYRKHDTLRIETPQGRYLADTCGGRRPTVFLRSTSASIGFHLSTAHLTFGYALGRQFEDILLSTIVEQSTAEKVEVCFDNDFWFHRLQVEYDFKATGAFSPAAYAAILTSAGKVKWSGWNGFECGTKLTIHRRETFRQAQGSAQRRGRGNP
jgi:hypothetical protein